MNAIKPFLESNQSIISIDAKLAIEAFETERGPIIIEEVRVKSLDYTRAVNEILVSGDLARLRMSIGSLWFLAPATPFAAWLTSKIQDEIFEQMTLADSETLNSEIEWRMLKIKLETDSLAISA